MNHLQENLELDGVQETFVDQYTELLMFDTNVVVIQFHNLFVLHFKDKKLFSIYQIIKQKTPNLTEGGLANALRLRA